MCAYPTPYTVVTVAAGAIAAAIKGRTTHGYMSHLGRHNGRPGLSDACFQHRTTWLRFAPRAMHDAVAR
jgi:hypothetical protein